MGFGPIISGRRLLQKKFNSRYTANQSQKMTIQIKGRVSHYPHQEQRRTPPCRTTRHSWRAPGCPRPGTRTIGLKTKILIMSLRT
jgi:hypothetical protein